MERNCESHVTIPFRQSLVRGVNGALLIAVGLLLARRWGGSAYGWVEIALMVLASFGAAFTVSWEVSMHDLRPERPQPAPRLPEPARMDVLMPTIPLAFDARDARRFIYDALVLVDGVWHDKEGGCSQLAMQARKWSRADWDAAVAWLLGHGILEWRNPDAHQQGTKWNWEKLNQFVGRES